MSVLFCDSNCELWYTKIRELGYNVISMPYTISGEEFYYDNGEKTDFKGFYDKVRAGAMPITSALNSTNYTEMFEPFFKKGEEILYISFSSKMSGTFEFMNTAVEELKAKYPKAKFTRYDTKGISMAAGVQVYMAGLFFKEGHTIEETIAYLDSITNNVCTLFMVDSLNHLKKGGRLSSSSAFFGSLMQIKPVLKINEEGALHVFKKQKGSSKAIQYMAEEFKAQYKPMGACPVVIVDADNPELAEKLEAMIKEAAADAEVWRQPVGPTIGTHCGPGTVGLIYPANHR